MVELSTMERLSLYMSQPLGILSFLACLLVALESAGDWRAPGETKLVTRIQFAFQWPLGMLSLMYGTSFALMDVPFFWGTPASCQVQGFLVHASITAAIFVDLVMSLCYLLMVEWQWQEQQLKRLEPWFHMLVWPAALGPAVYLLVQQMYAPAVHMCWIASCKDDPGCKMQHHEALLFRTSLHLLALFHVCFSVYVIARVYHYTTASHHEACRAVARRGLWYAASVMVVHVPQLVAKFVGLLTGGDNPSINALTACTPPCAGIFNMMVFMMYRREMKTLYGKVWRKILDVLVCHHETLPPSEVLTRDLFMTTVVEDKPVKTLSVILEELPSKPSV